MSFIEPASDEIFEALEPVGTPAPPEPPSPEPPPAADDAPAPDQDMFPRSYVEELRQEAAEWRTKYQGFNESFADYEEEERQQLLQYISLSRRAERGDQEALAQLQDLMADDDEDDDEPGVMTQEQMREIARTEAQQLLAQQQQETAQHHAIQTIQSRAKELGYEHDTPDYRLLLDFANQASKNGADDPLAAGHDMFQKYKQSIIEGHMQAVQEKNAQHVTQPVSTGQAPSQRQEPRTIEEARTAARERFANQGWR